MSKSIKISINYTLGSVLFILLTFSLYKQLTHQKDLYASWQQIKISWQSPLFWLVCCMMFINWGVEALKWKMMMNQLEKTSLKKAFYAVLAGCSVTMITPNHIGEYGGRILFVAKENRVKAVSISILNGISQLIITFLIGCLGILLLKFYQDKDSRMHLLTNNLMLLISTCCSLLLLLVFFYNHLFIKLLPEWRFLNKIKKNIGVVKNYTKKELLRMLLLSFIRYLVFILQYVIILRLMKVSIAPMICISLISIFYLMIALAPSIGLIELPIRATAATMILGLYSQNILGIQAAVFVIWLINLFIPSLIGSLLVFKNKIN